MAHNNTFLSWFMRLWKTCEHIFYFFAGTRTMFIGHLIIFVYVSKSHCCMHQTSLILYFGECYLSESLDRIRKWKKKYYQFHIFEIFSLVQEFMFQHIDHFNNNNVRSQKKLYLHWKFIELTCVRRNSCLFIMINVSQNIIMFVDVYGESCLYFAYI